MTKLLDEAIETIRALPPEVQEGIARYVMLMAGKDEPVIQMSPAEEATFAESRAQARRGEFISDQDLQALWSDDL